MVNVTFGGVGGQGILKASEICGLAAMYDGFAVKKSEVHGMAQRGGSVESHVRFGDAVFSPLVATGCTDFLVTFHDCEHDRLKHFLKAGGIDLIEYLETAKGMVTNPKHLNTCLMGVLASYLDISDESWIKALEAVFPAKILDENKEVFIKGKGLRKT